MTLYTGTKTVIAEPMSRQQYNDYRGWALPADENGTDEGYLVEYTDGGKANMPDRKGYVSWSPKDVFERAYKPVQATTEQAIQAAGADKAPRITLADLDRNIIGEYYFTAGDGVTGASGGQVGYGPDHALGLLTFCVLILRNGFTVTGESACVSPENFDAEIGRRIARENAINKIWPLMGYELRSQLARPAQPPVDNAHVAPGADQFDTKPQTTATDSARYAPVPGGPWPFPKSRA